MVPNQFSPHIPGSPKPVPLDKWSLGYSICQEGQAVGIREYGDQIGWGRFVQGDQIFWNHLSMGTEFDGDRCFKGINFMRVICPGRPEVRELNGFGTKLVAANMVSIVCPTVGIELIDLQKYGGVNAPLPHRFRRL